MTAYATISDMAKLFGQREVTILGDRNNDAQLDEDVLNAALVAAAEEINAYISDLYVLPVAPFPSRLAQMSCHIARYHLTGGDGALETDPIKARYDSTIRFLRDVAASKLSIQGLIKKSADISTANNTALVVSAPSLWGRRNAGGY